MLIETEVKGHYYWPEKECTVTFLPKTYNSKKMIFNGKPVYFFQHGYLFPPKETKHVSPVEISPLSKPSISKDDSRLISKDKPRLISKDDSRLISKDKPRVKPTTKGDFQTMVSKEEFRGKLDQTLARSLDKPTKITEEERVESFRSLGLILNGLDVLCPEPPSSRMAIELLNSGAKVYAPSVRPPTKILRGLPLYNNLILGRFEKQIFGLGVLFKDIKRVGLSLNSKERPEIDYLSKFCETLVLERGFATEKQVGRFYPFMWENTNWLLASHSDDDYSPALCRIVRDPIEKFLELIGKREGDVISIEGGDFCLYSKGFSERTFYAFETTESSFAALTERVSSQKITNCKIVKQSFSLFKTLDQLILKENLNSLSGLYIKGNPYLILKGSSGTLIRHKPILLLEQTPADLLVAYGYTKLDEGEGRAHLWI